MHSMRLSRRQLGGVFAATAAVTHPARAQTAPYPNRPIRVVVAWPAGGGVDTPIRLVSQPMGRFLGQPLVLDNRGGATGSIGEAEAARATPDGYTILGTGLSFITNPMLLRNLPYDPVTAFVPITQLISAPLLLVVRADHPARSLAELLEMARKEPGKLTFFSSGLVGGPHMTGLMLLRRAEVSATHVSYRGGSQSIAGVMGGDTDFGFSTLPQAVPLVREGRLRALAVSSPERLASLPDVPTVAEQGFPGFARAETSSLWALTGTPAAAITRLHEAAVAALAEPEVLARLEILGMTPIGSTPAQLGSAMDEYRSFAAEMIRAEGIKVE